VIIATHQITHIVVGLPSGKLVPEIKAFADNLNKAINLPIILHDETLTSQDAASKLVEAGAGRNKKKSEHSYSAALIL